MTASRPVQWSSPSCGMPSNRYLSPSRRSIRLLCSSPLRITDYLVYFMKIL
ncbi:unnamed protein product [Dibothriocephalus latus]|uniref:Uncharacterized protein n=1 Tax=Dibothriocephalus latus TaxID=60516 RepID=A0A3P7MQ01_DIBLA|nr:unnamed protein product [Dibothriocephalus latus]